MPKFRKKPVVIEAKQLTVENTVPLAEWCGGFSWEPYSVSIHTTEGLMEARIGDWIIQGVKGEFYPCKPDIFDATYDPVED